MVDFARDGQQAVEDGMIIGVEPGRVQSRKNRTVGRVVAELAAHLPKSAGIPELVAEVPAKLDALLGKPDVLALRRDRDDAEAEAVGAVFLDEIERIG